MIDLVSGVLAAGYGLGESFLGYAIPFVFVLSIVVFFHELGHFLVARWCGVAVETFSIGFGKAILSWTDAKGTRWQVGWLPLGGYVKFLGDANAASAPGSDAREKVSPEEAARRAAAGHFHFKPVWQRAAAVAAGPAANFLLAIFIFAGLFAIMGERVQPALIAAVDPDSAAAQAGFKPQDLVLTVNGRKIDSFVEMRSIVLINADRELAIEVVRDGKVVLLKATPRLKEIPDQMGNVARVPLLGVHPSENPADVTYVRYDPLSALVKGVDQTVYIVQGTFSYLGRLIAGREDSSQVSGFLGIAKASGDVAQAFGIAGLINLAAVLSVSIGLINLFPIPMLDGGHLLYYAYEAVRGRPLGERAQELGFKVGIALVLSLMIFATWNDLVKFQILG